MAWKITLWVLFIVGIYVFRLVSDSTDDLLYWPLVQLGALMVWFAMYCFVVAGQAKRQDKLAAEQAQRNKRKNKWSWRKPNKGTPINNEPPTYEMQRITSKAKKNSQ